MTYAHPTIAQTLLISLVGFLTVFVVLVVLMLIIKVMSKTVALLQKRPAPAPANDAPAPKADDYKGVKLINVSERDAALIMAIVADDLGTSPDHLRFISIKGEKDQ